MEQKIDKLTYLGTFSPESSLGAFVSDVLTDWGVADESFERVQPVIRRDGDTQTDERRERTNGRRGAQNRFLCTLPHHVMCVTWPVLLPADDRRLISHARLSMAAVAAADVWLDAVRRSANSTHTSRSRWLDRCSKSWAVVEERRNDVVNEATSPSFIHPSPERCLLTRPATQRGTAPINTSH